MLKNIFHKKQSDLQRIYVVLGSLILSCIVSYMYMTKFFQKAYGNSATLKELITGPSVFKDYFKPADFMIPRQFLLSFLVCFAIAYVLMSLLVYFHDRLTLSFYTLLAATGFFLIKQYFGYELTAQWMVIGVLFGFHVLDLIKTLWQKEKANSTLTENIIGSFISYFAVRAFVQMLLSFGIISESGAKKGFFLLLILSLVALIVVDFISPLIHKWPIQKIYMEGLQGLLLCFPLSLFTFHINYDGNIESTSFIGVRLLIGAVLVAVALYLILKRKNVFGQLHPHSLMIMGGMQLFMHVPVDAMFSVNLFHYGELTVPYTQLVSFNKLPYIDFFPIHGICDYFFSMINAVFMNGTYESFFYAYYIGSLILVAIVAYVVYRCFDSSLGAVVCMVFFMTIGEWYYYFRFILVLPILLIFFHGSVKKSAYKSLIVYIVSSIISIGWYPAIGGSLAVALLVPLAIRVLSKEGRKELLDACKKENYKKYLPSFVATMVLGISFVPMFFGIVRYLKENVGISDYFPGDRLHDIVISAGNNRLFQIADPFVDVANIVFVFMIVIVISVGLACCYKKIYGQWLIGAVIFSYMICSYTFGSIFAGERASIVNVVLLVVLSYIVIQNHEKWKVLPAALVALALLYNTHNFAYAQQSALEHQPISNQFVKISGEELGCPKMGNMFLPTDMAAPIQDTAFVISSLCPEGETYLDFTNQAAFYMMFNKETPFAYCALYHGTSDATRGKMLESLEEELPNLILVSPYWYNDGGSISLRYKEIYQYIWDQGYRPYQYGTACFLLSDKVQVPKWATDGSYGFFEAMTTSDLQALPNVWGRSMERDNFEAVTCNWEIIKAEGLELTNEGTYCAVSETVDLAVDFSGENISDEAEYLLVHFQCPELEEKDKIYTKMYFGSPEALDTEETSVVCTMSNGDLLIPLYAYPMWDMFEMTTIRFHMENGEMAGKTFSIDFELLKDSK